MSQETSKAFVGKPLAEVNPLHRRVSRILKTTTTFTIPFEERYMADHEDLVQMITMLRSMGCIIVFMTGVWDLFHIGHGDYIEKGKEEARKLFPDAEYIIMVVGIDTDEFTRLRKGPDRPIVPEDERARVLRHLRPVDIIVPQYEADQLFKVVEHDVRVISDSTKDLPNLEMIQKQCVHIVNLPPQAETSTTARIRLLSFDGAAKVLLKVERALTTALKEIRDEFKR